MLGQPSKGFSFASHAERATSEVCVSCCRQRLPALAPASTARLPRPRAPARLQAPGNVVVAATLGPALTMVPSHHPGPPLLRRLIHASAPHQAGLQGPAGGDDGEACGSRGAAGYAGARIGGRHQLWQVHGISCGAATGPWYSGAGGDHQLRPAQG